jgi:hypothetical protein
MGLEEETYTLPEEYAHTEVVFKHYFQRGEEKRKKQNAGDTAQAIGVDGLGIVGWLGRRYYVAEKMVSKGEEE